MFYVSFLKKGNETQQLQCPFQLKHRMPLRRMYACALHLSGALQIQRAKVFACVLPIISGVRGGASLAQRIVTK